MKQDIKVKCLKCEEIYYLSDTDATDTIPEGAEPGEAFMSMCPFCDGGRYATLVEQM